MTGPEHYQEAERLLSCEARDDAHEALLVASAQAHASLALAAATAEGLHIAELPNDSELPYVRREGSPWGKVLAP